MITTNLKIAIRSILKNKIQSIISIVGLGIGLGSILLLTILFIHENSFDRFIPNKDQLYRVIQGNDSRTSYPLAMAIKDEIPQVEDYFRYYNTTDFELKNSHNEIVKEESFACSDASIFNCLGVNFKYGEPAGSPSEVCLSEKMANKYFGTTDPTGESMQIRLSDEFISLSISGVYKNLPSNSTLAPNFIAHIDLTEELFGNRKKQLGQYSYAYDGFKDNWNQYTLSTYLLLNANANPAEVNESIQTFRSKAEDEKHQQMVFSLQAVTDIYLKSGEITGNSSVRQGDASEMKYYIIIASLILLIAMINYIFLTKAKIGNRLKEFGAKKALGASTRLIHNQILLESNTMAVLSLVPAFLVIITGIPFINSTLNRTLDVTVLSQWQTWPIFILITLLTGSLSGLLISWNIARVSPVLLLSNKISAQPKSKGLSHSFLSLHFAIFILLIVGVIVLKKQINFALTNFQSIDINNVIICELNSSELSAQFNVIENEMAKQPGVIKTAGSSFIPPFNWFLPVKLRYEEDIVPFDGLIMGKGMIGLLGIQLLEGEDFGEFREDRREMIFNESAALKYKLKAGELFNGFYVKGIVKDFNGHSLHKLIQPMVILQQHPMKMGLFAIKTDGTNDAAITSKINQLFKTISPDKIVSIYSLTDQIGQFYTREEKQTKLVSAFSLLAIILSVMGLLGMTLNTVAKKTKEIGIRKVNGAKVSEVLILLNLTFLKWVMVAIIIATPIAYFVMNKWLENFAYKTELSWWIFALAGLLALGIALLTVSFQSWKAATRNPVEALRYE
ncbi:MAG: ABC transporter permease [Prolixibacteraceae bacterium]